MTIICLLEKLVIIPTYNENENITNILEAIFSLQQDFHVLVIDDGSPDGTAEIVKNLFSKYPGKLFLEERARKAGPGYGLYSWVQMGHQQRIPFYF